MNTKKFIAADMRQALSQIREELGAEAVILSNRKLDQGVEIVAAADYDAYLEQSKENTSASAHKPAFMDETAHAPAPGDASRVLKNIAFGRESEVERKAAGKKVSQAWLREFSQAMDKKASATSAKKSANRSSKSAMLPDSVQSSSQAAQPAERPRFAEVMDEPEVTLSTAAKIMSEPGLPLQSDSPDTEVAAMRGELNQLKQLLSVHLIDGSWGNFSQARPVESLMFKRLAKLGLSPALCRKYVRDLAPDMDSKAAWEHCLDGLQGDLPIMPEDMLDQGRCFAMVGPAGVGKTTTIAKIATRFVLDHGAENLALVTTDSFRIAGHEQLKTLGRILGVPVQVATDQNSLQQIMAGLSHKQLILIDTAGLSAKDQSQQEQFRCLSECCDDLQFWLVLAATAQRGTLDRAVADYKHLGLAGTILTKLDESASLGEALSVAIEAQLPIGYITNGQNIPDDIDRPEAQGMVSQTVTIAKENQIEDSLVADLYHQTMVDVGAKVCG